VDAIATPVAQCVVMVLKFSPSVWITAIVNLGLVAFFRYRKGLAPPPGVG